MKTTFNGCSYSELWVSPENWDTTTAKSSLKKNWYIQCYFHDPEFVDKYPGGFPYRRKLNRAKTLDGRKAAALFLWAEICDLFDKGYNPITGLYMVKQKPEPEAENVKTGKAPDIDSISTSTPFIEALEFALKRADIASSTYSDIYGILVHFSTSAEMLGYHILDISTIKRKHIKDVFDHMELVKTKFSNHKYNKYRGYLSILFRDLVEYEVIEDNIITGMRKKKTTKRIREVLSAKERYAVDRILRQDHPAFWLFMVIFFHSGGRITELLSVKIKDVNLDSQKYKVLVKKGKQYVWVERVIKNIAVKHWRKAIFGGKSTDYVFSVGLVPGERQIRREMISRRWKMHVKDKLDITADFYALKHLNLDEITAALSSTDAARMGNHTNTTMVETVYAVGENERQVERLKSMGNEFA